jgi:hypothetical protein
MAGPIVVVALSLAIKVTPVYVPWNKRLFLFGSRIQGDFIRRFRPKLVLVFNCVEATFVYSDQEDVVHQGEDLYLSCY